MSVSPAADRFDAARAVADAVLYEGYVLYPYRASATQEPAALAVRRARAPRRAARSTAPSAGRCAPSASSTPGRRPMLAVRIRCLQVQHRAVECAVADGSRFVATDRLDVDGTVYVPWDEAVEHVVDIAPVPLSSAHRRRRATNRSGSPPAPTSKPCDSATAQKSAASSAASFGGARRSTDAFGSGPNAVSADLVKVAVDGREHDRLVARPSAARRDRQSLARRGAHDARRRRRRVRVVARPTRGRPCRGRRLRERRHVPRAHRRWRRRALVADHPLRPARGRPREPRRPLRRDRDRRDPRPARADPDRRREGGGPRHRSSGRRHHRPLRRHAARVVGPAPRRDPVGAASRRAADAGRAEPEPEALPWWDPGVDGAVDPWTDSLWIAGVAGGARGPPFACARAIGPMPTTSSSPVSTATVAGIFRDVDGNEHVAVTIDSDPATEALDWQGRYLYFHPDEVEPSLARRPEAAP